MADWDEDSPRLRQNLARILERIAEASAQRKTPTLELARNWQRAFLEGLKVDPRYVGAFRGEPGLERTGVKVGRLWGVHPSNVAQELREFEQKLQAALSRFDEALPVEIGCSQKGFDTK